MADAHPLVACAQALHPLLAHEAAEIDRRRELTPTVVAALMDSGLFLMLRPKFLGGLEMHPSDFASVTEALAAGDASTAWVVCQTNGCSTTGAYMDEAPAREVFGRPDGIVAWGPPGSPYEAEPVKGGYRISGTWMFASGCQVASWMGVHVKVRGRKEERTLLFPKSSVRIVDVWHVVGLRGTASNEYVVSDLFVPEEFTFIRDSGGDRRYDVPLYHFTSGQLYSCGFAGVALGVARGMLDAFLALPAKKISRGAAKTLRENNVTQSMLAQSEARWNSARAFLHNTANELYDAIVRNGEMTQHQAAMLRLASTWAIHQARDVANTIYQIAGAVAIFEDQPFERRMRDMNSVSQQAQGRLMHYESVGQIMFGMPPENSF